MALVYNTNEHSFSFPSIWSPPQQETVCHGARLWIQQKRREKSVQPYSLTILLLIQVKSYLKNVMRST